jgi:hypothetical protein
VVRDQGQGWVRFKAQRWRATSDPDAVAAYAAMFAQRSLPDRTARIELPETPPRLVAIVERFLAQ